MIHTPRNLRNRVKAKSQDIGEICLEQAERAGEDQAETILILEETAKVIFSIIAYKLYAVGMTKPNRALLLKQVAEEIAEQADWLVENPYTLERIQ